MEVKNISIIGTGNIAWAYAHAFYTAGIEIHSIMGRKLSQAEDIANQVRAEAYSDYAWVEKSDLILLCVSDDAITEVADQIRPYVDKNIVIHSAGSRSKSLLDAFDMHGVLWPVQTISKGEEVNWVDTPLIFDANDPEAASALRNIASQISNKVEMRNDAERRLIHLAAVWANNFSNHMYAEASEILDVAQVPFSILMPIIKETVEKLENKTPKEAQTGPASRNDEESLKNHMEILNKLDSAKSALYKLISDRIKVTKGS